MKAFVLIHIEAGTGEDVAKSLLNAGFNEFYFTVGTYDLVVVLSDQTPQGIARAVIERLQKIPGIRDTNTQLVAE